MTQQETSDKGSYRMLGMVIFLHTLNHMASGGLPILYPDMMDEFGITYAQLGVLRSATTFAAGFPQMFVGFFRRYFSSRVLVGAGNLINAGFNIVASFSQGFSQFIAFRILGGVGSSTQHPIGASLISSTAEPSQRGRMLGLNQAIPSLSFTFTPLLAAYLITRMGWRMTFSILSIPALVVSLGLLFFVRGSEAEEATTRDSLTWGKLKEALRNRNVMSISLVRTVMAFRMGVRAFLPLYFIDVLEMAPETSSLLYSIMLFGGVLGPFFWGNLSDRMNRKPLIIGITAASGVGYLSLNYVTQAWLLAPLLFLIGFLVQTVIVQSVLSDSVERSQLDQIFGFYFTIGFTLASISSVIFGYIIEWYGFNWGFTYIAAVTMVSILPALFIREPRNLEPTTLSSPASS